METKNAQGARDDAREIRGRRIGGKDLCLAYDATYITDMRTMQCLQSIPVLGACFLMALGGVRWSQGCPS